MNLITSLSFKRTIHEQKSYRAGVGTGVGAVHSVHIPRCTQVCTSMHDNINESVMYVYAFKGKSQSDD